MKNSKGKKRRSLAAYLGSAGLVAAGALVGALPASAQTASNTIGPGAYCVADNLGTPVNCTANDVRLAGVKVINGVPQIFPTECTAGSRFDLTATFSVVTTATQRFDIGVTFDTNGDPEHDGARTGECSRSSLKVGDNNVLDNDGDFCGDTASASGVADLVVTIPQVLCADTDTPPDGLVNLPYIVSWKNNAGAACNSPYDALPETRSKCKADDTFNIPVKIVQPEAQVTKAAKVEVSYTVTVKNVTTDNSTLTLTKLEDSVYGQISPTKSSNILTTDCFTTTQPQIAANGTYSCTFKVLFDASTPGSAAPVVNFVRVTGTGGTGGTQTLEQDSNTKSVTVQIQ